MCIPFHDIHPGRLFSGGPLSFRAYFRFVLMVILIALVVGLTACASELSNAPAPTPEGGVEVDTIFREFYQTLGGEAVLGPAISQAYPDGDYWEQYTVAGLMRYNRLAPSMQIVSMAPLGLKLNIEDKPLGVPQQDSLAVENGIIIYSKFIPRYKELQGARFVGKPLSQPRLETMDDGQTRVAQYFENFGFYTSATDPADDVHMLAYGTWDCDANCRYQPPTAAIVSQQIVYSQPFFESLSRLGSDFIGQALSDYYRAPDGSIEQVYENFVVFAPPDNMRLISLRPLPSLVGYPPRPLVTKNDAKGLVFKPIDGNLGHNVAAVFEQYIAEHGSMLFSGQPITEIFQEGSLYRQCFTAYCLDYDQNAPEPLRIRPVPLGKRYLELYPPQGLVEKSLAPSPKDLLILIGEDSPMISSSEQQKINLKVLQASDNSPVPNIESTLKLTLPGNKHLTYTLKATDINGSSSFSLDPIVAPNGTVIPYQICLNTGSKSALCMEESFLIWSNP